MKSILICHPGRCGSHWLLYMLRRLTGLSTLPTPPEVPPAEGYIWGTREQRGDLAQLEEQVDILFLLRDPRDVETSMRLYPQPEGFAPDADAILENLGWYRWYLEQKLFHAHFVRYEELWYSPCLTLLGLLSCLDHPREWSEIQEAVEAESFEARTGRARGEEDIGHHLRKGIVGDWKNHWSKEKAVTFMGKFAKEMRQLGY